MNELVDAFRAGAVGGNLQVPSRREANTSQRLTTHRRNTASYTVILPLAWPQVLVLDLNNVGAEGSRLLAEALSIGACASLQELCLGNVKCSEESFRLLGTTTSHPFHHRPLS